MEPKIQQFFLKLNDKKSGLATKVRDIVLSAHPSIAETLKWNQLTFVYGKVNIAFIYTYTGVDYINLGFFKATSLTDPNNLFQGTGKGMRHIKIAAGKDIPVGQIKKWIKEAITQSASIDFVSK